MRDPLKYVIVQVPMVGGEAAIVFDPRLVHKHVAGKHRVVSAGFTRPPDELNPTASAYGKSESLKIESRPEDIEILTRLFANDY